MTHGLSGQNPLHWPFDCANTGCGECESKSAHAQVKLDAYYTATLLGLPIGHISWVIDLKENRFSSVATGSIAGFLRLFLDAQGSVTAEGRLSSGKPVPSKFQLKLLAGKRSDEVVSCLLAIAQKNPYPHHRQFKRGLRGDQRR